MNKTDHAEPCELHLKKVLVLFKTYIFINIYLITNRILETAHFWFGYNIKT